MTSFIQSRYNASARCGLALAGISFAVSLAWWIRHGVDWVGSSDLLALPGPWQWGATIGLLVIVSGMFLRRGWKNATDGYGDDAKVLGGILLAVVAVVPLLIQGIRYLLWVLLVAMLIHLVGRHRR